MIALDLPGLRTLADAARRDLDRRLRAPARRAAASSSAIDAAAVVGNSMGGFIAAELAIAFPQRVERLVLVSAAGHLHAPARGSRDGRCRRCVASSASWLASAAWSASESRRASRAAPRLRDATLGVVVRHPSRLPAPLAAEQVRGAGKPGFIQGFEAVARLRRCASACGEIACPTLIVWGERDWLISVRDADVFAELIPDSRKVVFEDTGHMAMLERPAAFNALLRDFLGE